MNRGGNPGMGGFGSAPGARPGGNPGMNNPRPGQSGAASRPGGFNPNGAGQAGARPGAGQGGFNNRPGENNRPFNDNNRPNWAQNGAGTYHRPNSDLGDQAAAVRGSFNNNNVNVNAFTPGWSANYPGAWAAAGWGATTAWDSAQWSTLASAYSYPQTPMYYDYGTSVVYQGDQVYVNGDNVGSSAEYAQQATAIASTGREAEAPKDGDWTSLGVFALVTGQDTTSSDTFQLAINPDGVIRGTYYNAASDSAETVYGSLDKKTQRAAWTIGDDKTPVYEAGLANLTKDKTTILAHNEGGNDQQLSLVRIQQPAGGGK